MTSDADKWKQRFENERRARLEAETLLSDRLRHLFQVKAQLETANRELDAFAFSVSHDLRAPLRAIDGYSKLVTEAGSGALGEKALHYLQRIRLGCRRMAEIVEGLLELSRVSRWELRRQEVDLGAIAEDLVAELRGRDPARKVDFVVRPGLIASGDPRLLRVIVRNLFENSWKFTRNRPTARIEFGVTELDGAKVFFVRDDGAGFDMEHAGKLFGSFQRLHAEAEFEGTGIGLATVQRIVQRHGGRIWAEGAVDKGATFYFTV